jgi:hypothetical protein
MTRTATHGGRLELTWTNKHLTLLAHEDGSYEWLNPADYRVAEVRLLHDVTSVGEVGKRRAADNLLIRGDALNALTSLAQLPEFARDYLGRVKLAYIDPPFNTQQSFLHYDDALEHSVWLTMIRDRLAQIYELLAPVRECDTDGLVLHLGHRVVSAPPPDIVVGSDRWIAMASRTGRGILVDRGDCIVGAAFASCIAVAEILRLCSALIRACVPRKRASRCGTSRPAKTRGRVRISASPNSVAS